MELYIKNMVCNRCILSLSDIMNNAGYPDAWIKLGKVSVEGTTIEKHLINMPHTSTTKPGSCPKCGMDLVPMQGEE